MSSPLLNEMVALQVEMTAAVAYVGAMWENNLLREESNGKIRRIRNSKKHAECLEEEHRERMSFILALTSDTEKIAGYDRNKRLGGIQRG